MEIGFDSDCDDTIRDAFATAIGADLLDEDSDEIVEAVLPWWRDDDGDLVDGLMDALSPLADNGVIGFDLKPGRDGHIDPRDRRSGARTAGLQPTPAPSARVATGKGTECTAVSVARAVESGVRRDLAAPR